MASITVLPGVPRTITTSETDDVMFLGLGTLNVVGPAGSPPIAVNFSTIGGVAALDTINVSNATVTVGGVAGVSALVAYNIGAGGTLNLTSTVGVAVGTTIAFTAPNSHLVLGNAVNLSLLSGILGFGPGSSIDVSALAATASYADAPGANTGGVLTLFASNGLPIGSVALANGDFSTGNFKLAPDGSSGTLISYATATSPVTTTPSSGDLNAGHIVTLNVAVSDPVSILGGIPTLGLSSGGTATFDPLASTPTNLVFTYTVAAGQNTPDLTVASVGLNGASILNSALLPVDLSGLIGNPAGVLQIDTLAPTIASVTTSPGSGTVHAGDVVTLTLTPTEAVAVVGTPTLSLNDGGTAVFDPTHSTPTSLVFTTTVQPGQTSADLAVTGVNLAGATITDGAGNLADLSLAIGNPAGILQVITTTNPFAALSVTAANPSMIVTVNAAVRPGTLGIYSNLGGGSVGLDGSYSVTGTAAQVDQALANVTFAPLIGPSAQTGVTATLIDPVGSDARLISGSGNDMLTANTGLTGGGGADTLVGGTGFDLAYYDQATSAVSASLVSGGTLGDAAGDTFTNVDGLVGSNFDDYLQGNDGINLLAGGYGNDTLDGGGGDDAVFGQQGNDLLLGGAGDDLLRGGEGADTLDGGSGFNLAIYDTSATGVTASLTNATINTGEAAGDQYLNIQGFLGSSFDDVLVGDDSSNLLLGGAGNDTLIGGVGYDVMDGGAGNNVFIFDPNFQFDHIGSFQAGPASGAHDVLSFSSQIFQSAAAAKAAVYTDPNGDAYVYAGGTNIVVLAGVSASALTIDNFAIH